jgi:hypothetical protein
MGHICSNHWVNVAEDKPRQKVITCKGCTPGATIGNYYCEKIVVTINNVVSLNCPESDSGSCSIKHDVQFTYIAPRGKISSHG